jgi:hypothetical protein
LIYFNIQYTLFSISSSGQRIIAGGPGQQSDQLFIGSIPAGTHPNVIRAALSRFGEVSHVYVHAAPAGNTHGFASFENPQDAEAALNNQNVLISTGDGWQLISIQRRANRRR